MRTSSHHERLKRVLSLLASLSVAGPTALAQQVPDAGRILQEQRAPLTLPPDARGFEIEQPIADSVAPGGARVELVAIDIEGNSVFDSAQLLTALGDYASKQYDLAELHALADRLTQHYREAGYPFARAYLPAQRSTEGRVRIVVIEGRYGAVRVRSEHPRFTDSAESYLQHLTSGALIESGPLERAALLLEDLPGVSISSTMRPGDVVGAGDLLVDVHHDERLRSDLTLDNHGNRYSGKHRLSSTLSWSSPFLFGDQLLVQGVLGDEDLRVGSIDYSLPIGTHGLRAQAAYAYTHYELGEEFAILGAAGRARVASAGLSYPILRSHRANLNARFSYQHKALEDRYRQIGFLERKHSHVLPLSVAFSLRDTAGGGSLTFGNLTWTHGQLHLGDALRDFDHAASRTHGSFNKLNVDIARLQRLPNAFSLYTSLSAQWAADNLDSSESFGLGGATAIRAHPTGEAFGDEGWLGQIELRYALGELLPYVFFDHGQIRVNAKPGPTVERRSEHRSGAGIGLRWMTTDWRLEAVLAWRTSGAAPDSDPSDPQPRPWISVARSF